MRRCPGSLQTTSQPWEQKVQAQVQSAAIMRGSLLLFLVLLGLLATFARAEAPQEESLVSKLQVYVQQTAKKAQDHFATFQASQPVQQAREWLQTGLSGAREYADMFKETVANLFRKTAS